MRWIKDTVSGLSNPHDAAARNRVSKVRGCASLFGTKDLKGASLTKIKSENASSGLFFCLVCSVCFQADYFEKQHEIEACLSVRVPITACCPDELCVVGNYLRVGIERLGLPWTCVSHGSTVVGRGAASYFWCSSEVSRVCIIRSSVPPGYKVFLLLSLMRLHCCCRTRLFFLASSRLATRPCTCLHLAR